MENQNPYTTKPQITIIVATDINNGIGKDNDLMWHLSEDLKRFKAITSGHTIIMGRKTWDSLPKKPLPNRKHIIISSSLKIDDENVKVVSSPYEALTLMDEKHENFIIGGGQIYNLFLPFANKIELTKVLLEFDADTFFPEIDSSIWKTEKSSEIFIDEKTQIKYQYLTLKKQ